MSQRTLSAGLLATGLLATGLLLLFIQVAPAAAPPTETRPVMICKTYQVADLVIPIAGTFAARTADGKEAANRTHEDRLIQLICSILSPESWIGRGGRGSIDYHPLTMALVVRHTPDMQEQVADLLSALRRLQDVEVSVELRFLSISDECLAKLGIEDGNGGKLSVSRLDDSQVRLLLEAAMNDKRTNIMQAPKLTVFNGQRAALDLTEKQCFVTSVEMVSSGARKVPVPKTKTVNTGLQVSILPVVSADNREVTMQLGVSLTRCDAPRVTVAQLLPGSPSQKSASALAVVPVSEPRFSERSFQTTLKLTDGTSGLISGWTMHHEARNQTCPPVLSKIPYIGQLFRTMSYGKEREHLLVMVTPRIIVQAEKEETPPPAPKAPVTEASMIGAAEQAEEAPSRSTAVRADATPQVMNVHRRSFRLEYALDNVGPAGVSKLDVWYTRDTKSWVRYGNDVPAKGHATITVPEDGRWGFTLIPYNGAGRSASAPKAGDQPHVWVEVDTMLPQVELLSAQAMQVEGEGILRVEYRSEDSHLKGQPVTISYAASSEGPWTILSRNQDAKDTFTYPLDRLPHEFYVRVEAEDQAGNVGQKVSELIRADLKIPRVREVKVKVEE